MIPYRDENQTIRIPVITWAIIAINVLVWLTVQGAGNPYQVAASVCNYGLIPGELLQRVHPGQGFDMGNGLRCVMDAGRSPEHILYSMFLHGGWLHILGNMWFLWIFGDNVEDAMGRARYAVFYLLCGVAAAVGQVLAGPNSMIPMVGASGAISGVMGAYVVLYPRVKVYNLIFFGFFLTTIALPAWVMLGYWLLLQVLSGAGEVVSGASGGVAVFAHIAGFASGAALIKLFARDDFLARQAALQRWAPRRLGFDRSSWS